MKKPVLLSLACVLAALLFLFAGINFERPASVPVEARYVLLIEQDTGTFLMQLRKGMQEGATLQGARLLAQNASQDLAAKAEELALGNTTAAILLLDDPKPMLDALEKAGVPALVVGQTVRGQVCVISDDQKAGEALLRHALSLAEPSRILLLMDDGEERARERTSGTKELARRNQVSSLLWTEDMPVPEGYSTIVATSVRATLQLSEAKESGILPQDCLIFGVDTGDNRVQDLEGGQVSALILDNPYSLGYLAVEKARLLANGLLAPSLILCDAPLIDQGNMYLSENVKLVFPLLQ